MLFKYIKACYFVSCTQKEEVCWLRLTSSEVEIILPGNMINVAMHNSNVNYYFVIDFSPPPGLVDK